MPRDRYTDHPTRFDVPDYLRPGLHVVFVEFSPSYYSAAAARYFAGAHNAFWPALDASGLLRNPRRDLATLLELGFGFTHLVKRPVAELDEISRDELRNGARELRQNLAAYHPNVVCFVGLTSFQACFDVAPVVGLQSLQVGKTRLFVTPGTNPRRGDGGFDDVVLSLQQLRSLLFGANDI